MLSLAQLSPSLFDVTLVTDDGQHIQAHKIILSAGSHFFSDIFLKSNHGNMLIYLKGISSAELAPVLGFLYNGDAFIAQENLNQFIKTGKDLQVKGLEEEFTDIGENVLEEPNKNHVKEETASKPSAVSEEGFETTEPVTNLDHAADYSALEISYENIESTTQNELDLQLQEMVEKNDGVWRCKTCEKTSSKRGLIQRHAETHIKEMIQTCYVCSKTFGTRVGLRVHKHRHHKALSSA